MRSVISSERLVYRPLKQEDWPFFLALYQDRNLMAYIADPRDEEEIRSVSFQTRLLPWRKGEAHWLCLVIEQKGCRTPVGVTGFIERNPDVAEVGFILAAHHQRKGYGAESLNAIIRFAFDALGYRKLTATVTAGNIASKRLLLKSGFSQEGVIRQNYYLNGEWRDDWVFGLLAEEYHG